jgi:hypothetical protein
MHNGKVFKQNGGNALLGALQTTVSLQMRSDECCKYILVAINLQI